MDTFNMTYMLTIAVPLTCSLFVLLGTTIEARPRAWPVEGDTPAAHTSGKITNIDVDTSLEPHSRESIFDTGLEPHSREPKSVQLDCGVQEEAPTCMSLLAGSLPGTGGSHPDLTTTLAPPANNSELIREEIRVVLNAARYLRDGYIGIGIEPQSDYETLNDTLLNVTWSLREDAPSFQQFLTTLSTYHQLFSLYKCHIEEDDQGLLKFEKRPLTKDTISLLYQSFTMLLHKVCSRTPQESQSEPLPAYSSRVNSTGFAFLNDAPDGNVPKEVRSTFIDELYTFFDGLSNINNWDVVSQ